MKISWADRVRDEDILQRVEEKANILHTGKKKFVWVVHILPRNCLLKLIIEGKIEGIVEVR